MRQGLPLRGEGGGHRAQAVCPPFEGLSPHFNSTSIHLGTPATIGKLNKTCQPWQVEQNFFLWTHQLRDEEITGTSTVRQSCQLISTLGFPFDR